MTSSSKKRMEFVNPDLRAATNIKRCAVLNTRPKELTRFNVVGQPLTLDVHKEKLGPIAVGR